MLFALALAVAAPPAEEPPVLPLDRADFVSGFQAAFAAFDRDHDGRLSRAEWTDTNANRASPIRIVFDAPLKDVFRDMDRDGNDLVSFEEFVRDPLTNFDREAGRTRAPQGR